MASVIGRGYNGGISGSSSPAPSVTYSDTPAPLSSGSSSISSDAIAAAEGLGKLANTDASLFAALMRESSRQSEIHSAMSQEFAERQMDFQRESDRYAMNWSAAEAAKTRAWQENLANTAHQREVKDLIAAGLNPILSATHGGSVTPNGATGQAFQSSGAMGSVDVTNPVNMLQGFFSDILNSALSMKIHGDQMELERSRIATNERIAQTQADANIVSSLNTSSAMAYQADQNYAGNLARIEADKLIKGMDIDRDKERQESQQNWQSGENKADRENQYAIGELGLWKNPYGAARNVGKWLLNEATSNDSGFQMSPEQLQALMQMTSN